MNLVMVAGVARGGTSMTMGLLHCLDIPIPGRQNEEQGNIRVFNPWGSFESRRFDFFVNDVNAYFRKHVEAGKSPPQDVMKRLRDKYDGTIKQTIKSMEKEAGDSQWWAFKVNSIAGLELMMPYVKHLVLVTRSLVDNAKSYQVLVEHSAKLRNKPSHIQLGKSLVDCSLAQNALVQLAWRHQSCSKSYLSFEKIRARPKEIASYLAKDLGISFGERRQKRILDFVHGDFSTWKDFGGKAQYGQV